jgi:hypothetical protein
MKTLLATLLTFGALTASASDYNCKATLMQDSQQEAAVEMVSATIGTAKITSFQFDVVQTNNETLVISIFNRAKREQAAHATTFVPKKNQPSNLILRLADGNAILECSVE